MYRLTSYLLATTALLGALAFAEPVALDELSVSVLEVVMLSVAEGSVFCCDPSCGVCPWEPEVPESTETSIVCLSGATSAVTPALAPLPNVAFRILARSTALPVNSSPAAASSSEPPQAKSDSRTRAGSKGTVLLFMRKSGRRRGARRLLAFR